MNVAVANRPPQDVLEIGCGNFDEMLALHCGGLIFKGADIRYTGIDLPEVVHGKFSNVKDRDDVVAGSCADLPFEDGSFDVVLMRSVFGQLTMPEALRNIDDVRHLGLREAFRVMRPGAEIVVAEENTPWDAYYVESYLRDAGFQLTTFEHMREDEWALEAPDSLYVCERTPYFGDEPAQRAKWLWGRGLAPPYLMKAIRPLDGVVVGGDFLTTPEAVY